MKNILTAALAFSLLAGSSVSAYADEVSKETAATHKNETIHVTGTVANIGENSFQLDYGSQFINVNAENLDNTSLMSELKVGDTVSVSGTMINPWVASEQLVANEINITKSHSKEIDTIDPNTGEVITGTLTVNEEIEYKDAAENQTPLIISGEVTNIINRDLVIAVEDGTRTVDTMPLYVDPTGEYVFPKIEIGDSVELQAVLDNESENVKARKLIAIKKPYEKEAYNGQVLTEDGIRFVIMTQKETVSDQ